MTTIKQSKPTTRRKFLGGAAVVGVASVVAPNVVKAQGPISMRFQSTWPSKDIFHEYALDFGKKVNDMTGGDLKIEVLPAGAVVPAFGLLDAVSKGVLDGGHGVLVYHYGKNTALALWGSGPGYAMDANMLLAWHKYGGGKALLEKIYTTIGADVVSFPYAPLYSQPLGWFKNEVSTVADVQGLKYRTVGLAADLLQSMGMSVAQLPGGEIVPAMERGVIDAFEFNNPSSDRRFGAQDVAKNYYLSSYHQASESFEFIFNRDFMDDLPEDLQAILRYGVEASATSNLALAMREYSKDLAELAAGGVTVHRTSKDILAAQLEAWDTLIADLETDPFNKKIMDSQRAWTEQVAYYELMNAPDLGLAFEHYYPGKLKL